MMLIVSIYETYMEEYIFYLKLLKAISFNFMQILMKMSYYLAVLIIGTSEIEPTL